MQRTAHRTQHTAHSTQRTTHSTNTPLLLSPPLRTLGRRHTSLQHRPRRSSVQRYHSIPHETIAIADQDDLFPNRFPPVHTGGDGEVGSKRTADVLKKLHYVGRGEKMGTHYLKE